MSTMPKSAFFCVVPLLRICQLILLGFFLAPVSTITMDAAKPSPTAARKSKSMPDNPLFSESALPYHMPPFDRIKDADYAPAFEKGMADELQEVEKIANN